MFRFSDKPFLVRFSFAQFHCPGWMKGNRFRKRGFRANFTPMKKHIGIVFFLLLLVRFSYGQETPREFEMQKGDSTIILKQYFFCILLRGDSAEEFTEAELEALQQKHLDNINRLKDEGKVVIAGPFGDDTEKRGILIFDVATLAEAEAAVKTDPAVQAGRLSYEMHPWWTVKGSILK